jgi:predicted transcriptional regulator
MKAKTDKSFEQCFDNFDENFLASFGKIAFVTNRFIIHHMRRMMAEMNLDAESAIVWGLLGQLNVAHTIHYKKSEQRQFDDDGNVALRPEMKPVRLTDLIQVTGLPRETVRRKLKILEEQGKVMQTENRQWRILESGVDAEVIEFTKVTTRMLLETARDVAQLLNHTDAK